MELSDAIIVANRVYIIGNGGSYANAIHIANDLISVGVPAFTLDPATLTASANDFGYQTVFDRWIGVVGVEGDLLVALSGSGASANITNGLRRARREGLMTALITGAWHKNGEGEAELIIRGGLTMQDAEDEQIRIGHDIMRLLKKVKS